MIEHFAPERAEDEARLLVRPNLSLSLRQLVALFAALTVVSMAVAGIAWLQGNAFALPFATLYLSMLAICLVLVWRRGRHAEVIAVLPGRISVRRLPELVEVFSDHPCRARVVEDDGHVWLRSRRQRVAVGECLGAMERRLLAQQVRRLLGEAAGGANDAIPTET
jgi:uncharacterized membrane protein